MKPLSIKIGKEVYSFSDTVEVQKFIESRIEENNVRCEKLITEFKQLKKENKLLIKSTGEKKTNNPKKTDKNKETQTQEEGDKRN